MTRIITGFILLLETALYAASLSGYVADRETGETIIGVNVIVEGTDLGGTTDLTGFFIVRNIPPGMTTIRFSHIGYKEYRQTVEMGTRDSFWGTITLSPTVLEVEAIEVSAHRGNIIQKEMDIASFEVDPIVLKEVPQLQKDVFKLVKYSPSVTISDPYSPLYYVRGSDPGENLVQLDGMTIYNPQHTFSMEAIFNPYAIKNIEMLVGGFDAGYGGRNSSILYITSREGHHEEVRGEFKPSTSGLVGAIEFPVRPGGTGMVSGRVMSSLINRIMMGMPNVMADFNGAYQTRIKRTRLRLSVFFARDYIDYDFARFSLYFSDPSMRNYSTGFLTNTTNVAVGMQTRSIVSPNLVLESHLYYSGFGVKNKNFLKFTTMDTVQTVDVVLNYETRITNEVSDLTAKVKLTYFTIFNQSLSTGFEQNLFRFFNDAGLYARQSLSARVRSTLQALYVQDQIELGRILVKIGLRSSRFLPHNGWRMEPRASLALGFRNVTVKGAWGRYHQYITAMNTQDYELSQFLDYYYPLKEREPLTSTHYILGIEGRLTDRIDYSVSTYYKELSTLYRFDYYTTLTAIYGYEAGLERGTGEAYGAEFLVRGQIGRFSGWVGYALSRSTRSYPSIQGGKAFLYDGDQTHSLKGVLLYRLTRHITASTTFKITSGFPKTWETGYLNHYSYDPLSNTVGVFPTHTTPAKNNVRYPERIIWDIGWKKKLREGFGYQLAEYLGSTEAYFTMTIQNLLFLRRNPYVYVYIPEYGYYGLDVEYLPMVSAGYSITF